MQLSAAAMARSTPKRSIIMAVAERSRNYVMCVACKGKLKLNGYLIAVVRAALLSDAVSVWHPSVALQLGC